MSRKRNSLRLLKPHKHEVVIDVISKLERLALSDDNVNIINAPRRGVDLQSIVLGASGIVGGHIVRQLLLAGERPFALSRSPRADSRDVRWVHADLADPESLKLPLISTIYCTAHSLLLAKALPYLINDELRRVVLFT